MEKILFIDACVRPASRTRELAQTVLEALPGDRTTVCLYDERPACLDGEGIQLREQAVKSGDFSHPCFAPAKAFAAADRIVIAAPYWDLMFPAVLRAYLEQVTVAGITFRYTPQGRPEGLCKAKSLCFVTTAGGFIGENNFGFAYLEGLARSLLGIREVSCVYAEGLDICPDKASRILEEAKNRYREGL